MKLSKYQVLSSALIGYAATFYTDLKEEEIRDKLTCAESGMTFDELCFDACTVQTLKSGCYIVKTPRWNYELAKINLAKILSFIKAECKTRGWNNLQIKIGFDKDKADVDPVKLNICKFVLDFDEDTTYEFFPKQKNKVGSASIKNIYPSSISGFDISLYNQYLKLANTENRYYGVTFDELKNGFVGYRYIGGKNYQDKYSEISSLIDYYVLNLYNSLAEPEYTMDNIGELKKLSAEYSELSKCFNSYNDFHKKFKSIRVMVDMKEMCDGNSVYWPIIREKLYDVVVGTSGFGNRKANVNYDTDESIMQIAEADLNDIIVELNGVDVVDCKLSGEFVSCTVYNCDIKSSILDDAKCIGSTTIADSVITNGYLSTETTAEDCIIEGCSVISGIMKNCVIMDGVKYTSDAEFHKCKKKNIVKI